MVSNTMHEFCFVPHPDSKLDSLFCRLMKAYWLHKQYSCVFYLLAHLRAAVPGYIAKAICWVVVLNLHRVLLRCGILHDQAQYPCEML